MNQQKVYNLEEFATKYHIKDIYGAYAAYFSVSGFNSMVKERTLFTKILLVKQGSCRMLLQQTIGDEQSIQLAETFADHATRYQLTYEKDKSITDTFHFIRDIVRRQHINKVEMIRSMFNVLKLIIEELPYEDCSVTHDLGHKKQVYEIFLHHLYRNFRKERQIRFYADKLNVSPAYLSRLVKEISGSTINEHATSLVYKEICNLLTQTDMSMGEIAAYLNFSDQSAMTNFFKQRSGMSPLAYRNK